MKKFLILTSVLLLLALGARADFLIQPNDVIGIAGDSITQQHRYTAFIEDYLLMCQPTAGQDIVNFGWNGEHAGGFLSRLGSDVFPFKPTVLTTSYGMNDRHFPPGPYHQGLTDMVEESKKNGVRVFVLGSSKCVDSYYYGKGKPGEALIENQALGVLADIDKDVAAKEGVVYADVYGITLDVMTKAKAKFGDDYLFGGSDGVHPELNGHLVMAYAFLKALGCDGAIGTITVDAAQNQATGTPGQEIVSYKDGTVDVKSTRYPFCFSGTLDSKDPKTTAAITTVFPFNDDLNRYMLVVKGLTTAKANVTWGGTTKAYAATDLAKGINLAAEFLANPFIDQFNKVDQAVQVQEVHETQLYQSILHEVDGWEVNLVSGAFARIIPVGMAEHKALVKAAADLVVPIEHTIKIEPIPNT